MPQLTVIVPVYRAEQYIQRCAQSILGQQAVDLELLLVEDGSPDRSGVLCDQIAAQDRRVRVIHRENSGASAARNVGIEAASGTYIQFVDADDTITSDYSAAMLEAVEQNGADLAIAGYTIVQGGVRSCFQAAAEMVISNRAELCRQFDQLYFGMLVNSPCNKLYRRELLCARFPEDVPMGEDLLFNMAYLQKVERVVLLRHGGYLYDKDNEDSATKNFTHNTPERMLQYCRSVLPFLEQNGDGEQEKRIFDRIIFHSLCNNLNVAARGSGDLKKQIKEYVEHPEVREAIQEADIGDFPRSKRLVQTLLRLGWTGVVAAGLRWKG